MSLSRFVVRISWWLGFLVLSAGMASGQDPSTELRTGYPNKTIRIVTSGVGGGGDFAARQIAQGISGPLGQPVIVENRVAIISTETVAKSPPDGYTLLVGGSGILVLTLLQKTSYDVVRDFSPISLLVREVSVLAVHPSVPVKSVKELIALAKARPGELNYSQSGIGGPAGLGGELFKAMAGVNILLVPYKGAGPALTALLSGEAQLTILDAGLAAPHVKSGRLRALAVTSATPSTLVPGLPTVAAAGLPGYESVGWTGVLAPAKTPGAIINRLNLEIVRVLSGADVKEKFFNAGVEVIASSPEQYAAAIKSDLAKWSKVIKDAGIKVD